VTASEKLSIETPEQVSLEFPLAGAGSRFLALAIDSLVQIVGFAVLGLVALGAMLLPIELGSSWVLAILLLFGFLLYYGYYAIFEALWNGQTPGKRAMRLRVITSSGRPITPYEAILRNLVRIVDQLPGIYTVGVISMFVTERNQRLGDVAADTVVVHEQPIERHEMPRRRTPSGHRGASRLAAEEITLIETFLSRRPTLPDHLRTRTAARLASRVRSRLGITPEPPAQDEVFLEEVVAEYRGAGR